MIFGERNTHKKKIKELKNEIKLLKKQMSDAGCEKGLVNQILGEFEEILILAEQHACDYKVSSQHIEEARVSIKRLLECMGESPVQEVRQSLDTLVKDLDLVYHDCSIRQDDMDFMSTITCLKRMVNEFGMTESIRSDIMLRSELENTKAVLDDAAGFRAPDFFALAYYELYEEKDVLKEMENEQRNVLLEDYVKEHFMEQFCEETKRYGITESVEALMKKYLER